MPTLCPSAHCTEGALLLGILMPDGRVAFAPQRIRVDAAFVGIAHQGRPPEQRFRFASPCVKGACRQWTGARCSLVDAAVDTLEPRGDQLPACAIRDECRWYQQRGTPACLVCPDIVRDVRVPATGEAHDGSTL